MSSDRQKMGAHFNLITVWPHPHIRTPSQSDKSSSVALAGPSDQLILRKIYLFISLRCSRFSACTRGILWRKMFEHHPEVLRFTCEETQLLVARENFMRKCNKPATYLSSHFYAAKPHNSGEIRAKVLNNKKFYFLCFRSTFFPFSSARTHSTAPRLAR